MEKPLFPAPERTLNHLSVYSEAGTRAGRARRNGDEATAQAEERWFRAAKQHEKEENRSLVQTAFDQAYREAARRSPLYFT